MKLTLAAIARNEGAYIPSWIFHHRFIGFTDFVIWVSNTTDDTEQILQKLSNHEGINVNFRIVDDFFRDCVAARKHFQVEAYKSIWKECWRESDYLMFLDLDEYILTGNELPSLPSILGKFEFPDAMAIQWMLDRPGGSEAPFRLPVQYRQVTPSRHVKTIFRPKCADTISVHSIGTQSPRYITSTGHFFPNRPDSLSRQLVGSKEADSASDILVLHALHRSQKEYFLSLARGRADKVHINGDTKALKDNRSGYVANGQSSYRNLEIQDDLKQAYLKQHDSFIKITGLSANLEKEQLELEKRVDNLCSQLASNNLDDLYIQLRGVRLLRESGELFKRSLRGKVETGAFVSPKKIEISGWAYDWVAHAQPHFQVVADSDKEVIKQVEIVAVPRPDVVEKFPDAPTICGFKISIETDLQTFTKHSIEVQGGIDGQDGLSTLGFVEIAAYSDRLPELESRVLEYWKSKLTETTYYLEYGSGGSTISALRDFSNLEGLFSVESDPDWANTVFSEIPEWDSRLSLRLVDLGPVKALGYPESNDRADQFWKYAFAPWEEAKKRNAIPSLVLIDGRFRVACFYVSLLEASPKTTIILNDFVDRPHYASIEEVLPAEELIGRAAVFLAPVNIDKKEIASRLAKSICDAR